MDPKEKVGAGDDSVLAAPKENCALGASVVVVVFAVEILGGASDFVVTVVLGNPKLVVSGGLKLGARLKPNPVEVTWGVVTVFVLLTTVRDWSGHEVADVVTAGVGCTPERVVRLSPGEGRPR